MLEGLRSLPTPNLPDHILRIDLLEGGCEVAPRIIYPVIYSESTVWDKATRMMHRLAPLAGAGDYIMQWSCAKRLLLCPRQLSLKEPSLHCQIEGIEFTFLEHQHS